MLFVSELNYFKKIRMKQSAGSYESLQYYA